MREFRFPFNGWLWWIAIISTTMLTACNTMLHTQKEVSERPSVSKELTTLNKSLADIDGESTAIQAIDELEAYANLRSNKNFCKRFLVPEIKARTE